MIFLDTSATEKGQFFLSYTAEDHQMNDLVSGSDDVPDETGRDRNSFSHVLFASYALTDHWSFSALVSYVEHKRRIGGSFLAGETRVSGLGAGVRGPTGENDAMTGFVISEDMQPGMGAWGRIAWASYAYAFNQAATLQAFASVNYSYNGENDRGHTFGHGFNITTGISHGLGERFSYSAAVRYRETEPDLRRGFELPNTGGRWLDFVPALRTG